MALIRGGRVGRDLVAATVAASLAVGSPALLGGCSFVAVQSPRKDDRGRLEAGDCTTSLGPPMVDGILMVLSPGGALYVSRQQDSDGYASRSNDHDGALIAGVTLAVLFGVSALYGVIGAGNCRVARGLAPASGPAASQQNANRRAEEAAEEAAVQARLRAQTAADAQAATANSDGGAPPPAPSQQPGGGAP